MLKGIRSRLTYANVMATIAVFVALGGASYAAVKLPKNSVGATQIKSSAVTGAKVKNGSLTGADVKDKSLAPADFNGSVQGPAGAQGPAGPKGDTGAKGETGATGPAGPQLTVVPSGETVTGVYDVTYTSAAGGAFDTDTISYSVPMPSQLTPHVVLLGGMPPAQCTGTALNPTAAPGHVCVYESQQQFRADVTIVAPAHNTANQTDQGGFTVRVQSSGAGVPVSRGGWAATAP